ncbi:MAG TPA: hypothetical protein VHT91_30260 [Kofleriaceae bacterium]|nr:hypothetical protein [Kofleriaceae bacterium]
MIWEPFVLALVLGLIISAGLYFAYLWPSVEPVAGAGADHPDAAPDAASGAAPAASEPAPAGHPAASPPP